jgi:hypothetical protein
MFWHSIPVYGGRYSVAEHHGLINYVDTKAKTKPKNLPLKDFAAGVYQSL